MAYCTTPTRQVGRGFISIYMACWSSQLEIPRVVFANAKALPKRPSECGSGGEEGPGGRPSVRPDSPLAIQAAEA